MNVVHLIPRRVRAVSCHEGCASLPIRIRSASYFPLIYPDTNDAAALRPFIPPAPFLSSLSSLSLLSLTSCSSAAPGAPRSSRQTSQVQPSLLHAYPDFISTGSTRTDGKFLNIGWNCDLVRKFTRPVDDPLVHCSRDLSDSLISSRANAVPDNFCDIKSRTTREGRLRKIGG